MRLLVAAFVSFLAFSASGQSGSPAGIVPSEMDTMAVTYSPVSAEGFSPLFNGRQFYGYPVSIEGHAFYLLQDWSSGSVLYDGIWYRNVQIMYDIYRDEVIVKHPNGIPVILITDRVQQFSFQGQIFLHLRSGDTTNMKSGFYQVLARGRAALYVKRAKILDEKIEGMVLERKFLPADAFYILKDNRFYSIRSQATLYNALKERRQAIQQYRKQNGLRYKLNPEDFIRRLTEHYNQINP